jgi:hypothetical protein
LEPLGKGEEASASNLLSQLALAHARKAPASRLEAGLASTRGCLRPCLVRVPSLKSLPNRPCYGRSAARISYKRSSRTPPMSDSISFSSQLLPRARSPLAPGFRPARHRSVSRAGPSESASPLSLAPRQSPRPSLFLHQPRSRAGPPPVPARPETPPLLQHAGLFKPAAHCGWELNAAQPVGHRRLIGLGTRSAGSMSPRPASVSIRHVMPVLLPRSPGPVGFESVEYFESAGCYSQVSNEVVQRCTVRRTS